MTGTVLNQHRDEIYFNEALKAMDEEIYEKTYEEEWSKPIERTDQDFFDTYCKFHKEKFHEEFFLNEKNPTY